MMINNRLIAAVGESKKYIAGNVALQWCALAANIAMIGVICRLLEQLYRGEAGAKDLLLTAAVAALAVIVRFCCNIGSARMGYLSSKAVKKTLREQIYAKLLRLGSAYYGHGNASYECWICDDAPGKNRTDCTGMCMGIPSALLPVWRENDSR